MGAGLGNRPIRGDVEVEDAAEDAREPAGEAGGDELDLDDVVGDIGDSRAIRARHQVLAGERAGFPEVDLVVLDRVMPAVQELDHETSLGHCITSTDWRNGRRKLSCAMSGEKGTCQG